jgi:hypothetical protein
MNRTTITSIICLLALSMISGCTFNVSVNNESEIDMGTHHVVVKPGSGFTSSSSMTGGPDETHTFTCGEVTVKIENEILFVNDKNYGALQVGQSIEFDHGKVFVATEQRTGSAVKTEQD